MKKLFIICFGVSIFYSCNAYKLESIQNEEIYNVINSTYNLSENTFKIYQKSYTDKTYNKVFLRNELKNILIGYSHSSSFYKSKLQRIKEIDSEPTLKGHKKDSLVDEIVKSLELSVDDFLTKEDLNNMASMGNKMHNWRTEDLDDNITVSNDKNVGQISVPVFNIQSNICAYFLSSNSSLELIFCKKDDNGNWYRFAESLIWIS
jgi:hypothetical protein